MRTGLDRTDLRHATGSATLLGRGAPGRGGSRARDVTRIATGVGMLVAGIGHLTFARRGFQAQVPDWVPLGKDATVLASGVVEIGIGSAMIAVPPRFRGDLGAGLAAFLVAVYPGNIHQYTGHHDGLGLNTDRKRFIRLFFQPLMVAAAWWSTRTGRR